MKNIATPFILIALAILLFASMLNQGRGVGNADEIRKLEGKIDYIMNNHVHRYYDGKSKPLRSTPEQTFLNSL